MSTRQGTVFRVFEGSDCNYRYISGAVGASDHIVWGTHLYNLRVHWRAMSLLQVLTQMEKRKQQGGEHG